MVTATIPASRGMLCAVAGVPGRVGLPMLEECGRWWVLTYDCPRHAVMALRWAALEVRERRAA